MNTLLVRIYSGLRTLSAELMPPVRPVVHIHPDLLRRHLDDGGLDFVSEGQIFGHPFKTDDTLPEDGIVIRLEVVA